MARRFCQDCGAAAEPAAGFCATCGARLAVPPGAPEAPGTAEPTTAMPSISPAERTARWSPRHGAGLLGAATLVAVVALLGGALALDRVAGPGASTAAPTFPGGSPAAVATLPPTATPPPAATPFPTSAPTPSQAPAASPPYVAGETPIEAVAAFLEVRGLSLAGVCSATDPLVDTGAYCTQLVDERPGLEVHRIGLVGSEPDTWLLVAAGQLGWAVVEWQPMEALGEDPPF